MTYRYQLIFLGDTNNSACESIKDKFYQKTRSMGISNDAFIEIYSNNFFADYQNKQPSFVYYFGNKTHKELDADKLKVLMENGEAIIPVYFHADAFYEEIPKSAWKMNGKLYESEDEVFVNYALESLRLMRENRKLFISYRRSDSTVVANQLFDALVRCNYDVFLDKYSINAAKNFQEELYHRLSDCDILIQLYTKDFKESTWCMEEITVANQKQIGIIEVIWPDIKLDIHNHLCEPVFLTKDNFEDNYNDSNEKLTIETIKQLEIKVESIRARNMAARQDSLVGEFVKEAQKVGRELIQEYKYLVEYVDGDEVNVFIPAVGVPQSYDCYESLRFKDLLNDSNTHIYLIYDDLRIKRSWIKHLDWLNDFLEVKTIKKNKFSQWLQKK